MSSDLQKKLLQFEAKPSPKVWSNLETILDADVEFPVKLYEFKQQPAPRAWQKIASALSEHPATVVPFAIRYRKPIRYTAAAAVLILLAFGATFFMSKKASPETAAITTQPVPTQNTSIPARNEIAKQEPIITNAVIADNKYEANKNVVLTKECLGVIPQKNIMADNVTPECLIAEVKDRISHLDLKTSDRFMVYCCDGKGNPVKLPKKLYDVVNCGEDDPSCRQNIQCLQEKISSASLTTDFIGVLQIIRQVQENH